MSADPTIVVPPSERQPLPALVYAVALLLVAALGSHQAEELLETEITASVAVIAAAAS